MRRVLERRRFALVGGGRVAAVAVTSLNGSIYDSCVTTPAVVPSAAPTPPPPPLLLPLAAVPADDEEADDADNDDDADADDVSDDDRRPIAVAVVAVGAEVEAVDAV